MKPRKTITVNVRTHCGRTLPVEGELTVFGLAITPWLNSDLSFDEESFAITEPVTGYKITGGFSKIEALQNLREIDQEQRGRTGSFLASLDMARRHHVVMWSIDR